MHRKQNKQRGNQKLKVASTKKVRNVKKLGRPTKVKRQTVEKLLAEAKNIKAKELDPGTENALRHHEDKDL